MRLTDQPEVAPTGAPVGIATADDIDQMDAAGLRQLVRRLVLLLQRRDPEDPPGEVINGGLALVGLAAWLTTRGLTPQAAVAVAWRAARTSRPALSAVIAELGLSSHLPSLWTHIEVCGGITKPRLKWRRPRLP